MDLPAMEERQQEFIENLERLYIGFQSFRCTEGTYVVAVRELVDNFFHNEPMSDRTLDLLTTDTIKGGK